jgi:hypothetical protein
MELEPVASKLLGQEDRSTLATTKTNSNAHTSMGGEVNDDAIKIVAASAAEQEESIMAGERSSPHPPPPPAPTIAVGQYNCDLVQEYQRSKGHCFLVLDDCTVDQANSAVEQFLMAAQDMGKLVVRVVAPPPTTAATAIAEPSPSSSNSGCWDCQLLCGGGQALIRTAALPSPSDDNENDQCRWTTKSLVQVYRCSGCCYGIHMLRKKLFHHLKAFGQNQLPASVEADKASLSSLLLSSSLSAAAALDHRPSVPFDFIECTAAMRQEFQSIRL